MHPGMRIERAAALLASLYANRNSKRGGFSLYDFMPHEEEPELSLDEAMNQWN